MILSFYLSLFVLTKFVGDYVARRGTYVEEGRGCAHYSDSGSIVGVVANIGRLAKVCSAQNHNAVHKWPSWLYSSEKEA